MHYVVGDVHGCYEDFQRMISKIEKLDKNAAFLLVGDIIDRGPDTVRMLDWALKHITDGGKYQMVLGNHEDMIITWHREYKQMRKQERNCGKIPSCHYPQTTYDFRDTLKEYGLLHEGYLVPVVRFFSSLPLYKVLHIQGIRFVISHAYLPSPNVLQIIENGKKCGKCERNAFLWERVENTCDYPDRNTIIIHGHSPTIRSNPYADGEIQMSGNVINVDCGCVFRYYGLSGGRLAAVCMETLDEYYV